MKKLAPGALAGLAAAVLLAAPALAAPANVTVRVEGQDATLVPRTAVATTAQPVLAEGANSCPGTTAGGALFTAVGGDLGGTWGGFGFELKRVKGETQTSASGADPARYWSFWVNHEYQNQGICATELQEGDEVLVFADCFSMTAKCVSLTPLRLAGVPASAAPGQTVTVRLEEFTTAYDPGQDRTNTFAQPAAGATISAGGQTVTTDAAGTAQLTLSVPGPVSITAVKAGHVRTAAVTCVTSGGDGNCGTQLPAGTPLGTEKPDDTTAPVARLTAIKDRARFSRKRAPRELKGTVSADPSGIKSVRLSILRKRKGRCWAFDGDAERFKRHRCGGSRSFRIGDRAEWSYLLPRRLPVGRYAVRVAAIDKAGNAAATTTRLRVR
jgi:hypothetical protein